MSCFHPPDAPPDGDVVRKLAAILMWLPAAGALAHDVEEAHARADALRWGAEPWVLLLLAVSVLAYALGLRTLWRRARTSRVPLLRQALWFGLGWTSLVLALASPLDSAGSFSFAAHMVQHEVLMTVAAPLLVLGRPLGVWLWAFPHGGRRSIATATRNSTVRYLWRTLTRPLNAWLLHFAALWLWHLPSAFQSALASNGVHALQHACFLFPALLFWWAVLGRQGLQKARAGAILYLFTTMIQTGVLGALLTMSDTVWYPFYGDKAEVFGLGPLQDQQLGGLIMWIPGSLAYMVAVVALCARWLREVQPGRSRETPRMPEAEPCRGNATE